MVELPYDACARSMALLNQYSFDLGEQTTEQVVIEWLTEYPPNWIDLAVIEALYQGRYKSFSVSKILLLWKRRGKANYHFTAEFEHLVCQNISQFQNLEPSEPLIDELNNPMLSSGSIENVLEGIVLRPVQSIVVPIQYPSFLEKLKVFVAMDSNFLMGANKLEDSESLETDANSEIVQVIDVPTIETAKIIDQ